MNYTELLNKLINESGMQQKEILTRCKEMGEEVTQSYLSNLKTIKGKTASEKISKVIAKACNAEYEDILIVQAYIDKAPKPILKFFELSKLNTETEALYFLEGNKNEMTEYEFKKEKQERIEKYQSQTLAEYICESIEAGAVPTIEEFNEQIELIKKANQKRNEENNLYALIPIDKEKRIRYLTEEEIDNIKE